MRRPLRPNGPGRSARTALSPRREHRARIVVAGPEGRPGGVRYNHVPARSKKRYTGYQPYCFAARQSHIVEPCAQLSQVTSDLVDTATLKMVASDLTDTAPENGGFTYTLPCGFMSAPPALGASASMQLAHLLRTTACTAPARQDSAPQVAARRPSSTPCRSAWAQDLARGRNRPSAKAAAATAAPQRRAPLSDPAVAKSAAGNDDSGIAYANPKTPTSFSEFGTASINGWVSMGSG